MPEDITRDCRILFDLMRRFWSGFGHQLNNVLVRGDINVPQYMAMVALREMGEATMGQLSKRLQVTMGASTNIVDKLVSGGYVSRSRNTEDRRVVKVLLGKEGHETLRDVEEEALKFMTRVLSGESPEHRKQLIESYGRMVAVVESQGTAAAVERENSR